MGWEECDQNTWYKILIELIKIHEAAGVEKSSALLIFYIQWVAIRSSPLMRHMRPFYTDYKQ